MDERDANPDLSRLKSKWSIYTHGELKQRCAVLGSDSDLIHGLLPDKSVGLVVGDSGLGKSALVYQIALCVAAGIPFLGRPAKQGRVLCLDFENGLGQVDQIVGSLCAHLGLTKAPDDLILWNINDCSVRYGQEGHTAHDMILEAKPTLVTIDSLTGLYPEIEEKNQNAIRCFQKLREMIRQCGTSSLSVHHIRKPSDNPAYAPKPLESCTNVREWFNQARGARAIINQTDARLGLDTPHSVNVIPVDGNDKEEIALVMRGFGRVRGEIPLTYLSRHFDDNGEPLGYGVLTGTKLLFNADQEAAFAKLPKAFRFKDARQVYGRADQATTDFLSKCIGLGILRKVGKQYEKLSEAE